MNESVLATELLLGCTYV